MSELPQVGQTYKHKAKGLVTVTGVHKKGRGYYVRHLPMHADGDTYMMPAQEGRDRLKDWQKATA